MARSPRRRRRVEKWLSETTTPVFVLTDDLVVSWFNAGCEQLTGWSSEEVVGQRCEYTSEEEPGTIEALLASLCPPPEMAVATALGVPAEIACRDKAVRTRLQYFLPLEGADGQLDGILALLLPLGPLAETLPVSAAHRLHAELAAVRGSLRQRYGFDSLIGTGPAMTRVLQQVELAAGSNLSVCLLGEPGSGREHTARAIHYDGEAGQHSFVPLQATTLPPAEQAGVINRLLDLRRDESAAAQLLQPGTLFLANVDHLPRDIQQRLLDRLDADTAPAIRLMASCTIRLEEAVEENLLLPELFYRVSAIPIEMPPLRERTDDFRLLAQHFLERANRETPLKGGPGGGPPSPVGGLAEETWTKLGQYLWPGNLDELDAVIREAAAAAAGREGSLAVEVEDLPFRFRTGLDAQRTGPPRPPPVEPLEAVMARVEREQITRALVEARGNKSLAAKLLGLTRPKLYRRMEQLGLQPE